jgi:hypothetical protein
MITHAYLAADFGPQLTSPADYHLAEAAAKRKDQSLVKLLAFHFCTGDRLFDDVR